MRIKSLYCLLILCFTNVFIFAVPNNGNLRMNPTGVKCFKSVKTAKVEWYSTSDELTDINKHQWSIIDGSLDIFPATNNSATFDKSRGYFDIDFQKAGHYEVKLSITYKYKDLIEKFSKTFVLDLVEVRITNKANPPNKLSIAQEKPGNTIKLTAEVIPANQGRIIDWEVLPLFGGNFVSSTYTSSVNSGTSEITIILEKSKIEELSWRVDTFMVVKAFDSDTTNLPDCQDLINVEIYKFTRNGKTAPGNDPIEIGLSNEAGQIGYQFTGAGVSGQSLQSTINQTLNQIIRTFQRADLKSGNLKLNYKSNKDYASGSYSISETFTYIGSINLMGVYNTQPNASQQHQALVALAGGTSAFVDNDSVNLISANTSIAFTGYNSPITLTIGPLTSPTIISNQNLLNIVVLPKGSFLFSENNTHNAGDKINVSKKLDVNSEAFVDQQLFGEWLLNATSSLTVTIPKFPVIEFTSSL